MSNNYYMYLSIFLFCVSIYIYRRTGSSAKNRFFFSSTVFASIVFYLIYAISNYFTGDGIDKSVIYHVRYGLGGAGFSEYWELITASIVFIILGGFFSYWIPPGRVKNTANRTGYVYASYALILLSLLFNPAISDLYSLQSYKSGNNDFYSFYRQPNIKQVDNSRNLVVIYAEGLEQTYFDETIFPGVIKGLRRLQSRSTYFTNINQVDGSGWTIAGMVASQCGIPLFTPSDGNSMAGMDKFLQSVCLGDLLHNQGYHLTYYGGAPLDFAGKGKFLSTHKFDDIYGDTRLSAKLKYKSYRSGWGLYDDTLFDLAYEHFMELSALGNKFGLFMLTLDTHAPNGHVSVSCSKELYENPILNAVACSDYLITDFVNKIMQSPYGEKTVVVVLSDHLALRNSAYDLLNSRTRSNLFMIIERNINKSTKIEKKGSTLDIATTILPFIGYEGSIGLGRNLTDINESSEDIEYIQKNLPAWEPSISQFWNFPKIHDVLEVNITDKTIIIDNRIFSIPVLIELNSGLETILNFQHYDFNEKKMLFSQPLMLDESTPFILIDECEDVSGLDKESEQAEFCMVTGKGGKYFTEANLDENVKFTSRDIQRMTGITPAFKALRIAHAGGGINGKTYTNSHESLDQNMKNNFLYFELDFSFTKDNQLVCIHDWTHSFKRSFGFEIRQIPTLSGFKLLVKNNSDFNKCTLDSLVDWMNKNKSAYIITDVKTKNIEALKIFSEALPDFKKRIIPQIYNPDNFDKVKKMGYEQIIWTLYRYNGTNDDVLDSVSKFKGPIAVTMPKIRAMSTLPRELAKKNIPTYVHTVNSIDEMNKFITHSGVTEIYTDFIHVKN